MRSQQELRDLAINRVWPDDPTEAKIVKAMAKEMENSPKIRVFDTGANRDTDEGKLDYEGFLSPLVLERYAEYLHENRKLPDGTMRDGDNWQKGMPLSVYMKSAWRHLIAWWKHHRHCEAFVVGRNKNIEDAICAVIFNASGYLHEHLKVQVVKEDKYDLGHTIVIPPLEFSGGGIGGLDVN